MIAEFQCYAIPFQLANSLQQTQLQERTQQLAIPNSVLTISEEPFRAAVTVTGNSITRADIAELAGRREQNEFGNRDLSIRYEMTAIFSQDTRICRVCADTTICGRKDYRERMSQTLGTMFAASGYGLTGLTLILAVNPITWLSLNRRNTEYGCDVKPTECDDRQM